MSSLPKPLFDDCDETSLRLKWDHIDLATSSRVFLQYKEIFETWEDNTKQVDVTDTPTELNITAADVVDLKPGTPYCVRLAVQDEDKIDVGPETVFDTKPIDCTPKQKKCVIS